MDIAIFIQIILGLIFVTIVVILITTISGIKKKTEGLYKPDVLTDELDRQKKVNIQLEDELKKINSVDNIFFASMIRLTSRLKSEEIAKEIAGLLENCLNPKEIAVFLSDEGEKRLNIVAHRGLSEDWIPRLVYELDDKYSKGKVGVSFEKKIPIGEREFAMLGIQEPYPIFNPDVCYPLSYQNKRFGVIAITGKKDLSERERNLLGVVTNIAGVALNNMQSFEDITFTARTDPLTKLYNIGYFKERFMDEINRAKRSQHNLSVAIIDLDNFKAYNDTYGHQAGDQLLIRFAQIFKKHFGKIDTLARYGGDEFIVMCPEIKKQEAAKSIDVLLRDLEMYDFARGKQKVKVTFSAGVSSYPDDGANGVELIKLADQALYSAKGAGRNTVQVYRPKIEKI